MVSVVAGAEVSPGRPTSAGSAGVWLGVAVVTAGVVVVVELVGVPTAVAGLPVLVNAVLSALAPVEPAPPPPQDCKSTVLVIKVNRIKPVFRPEDIFVMCVLYY
jgi:hypothetical protein